VGSRGYQLCGRRIARYRNSRSHARSPCSPSQALPACTDHRNDPACLHTCHAYYGTNGSFSCFSFQQIKDFISALVKHASTTTRQCKASISSASSRQQYSSCIGTLKLSLILIFQLFQTQIPRYFGHSRLQYQESRAVQSLPPCTRSSLSLSLPHPAPCPAW
jgi:hypothetical protein